jgi:ABC-type transport system substrate-binding protein
VRELELAQHDHERRLDPRRRGAVQNEGLTAIDYDGKVINVLAEQMTPSKDAKTWTIRLREGHQDP